MEDPVLLACAMNNSAVDFLVAGVFDAARVLLAEALQKVRPLIEENNDHGKNCAQENDTGKITSSIDWMFPTRPINFQCAGADNQPASDERHDINANDTRSMTSCSEGETFVYQRAFRLRFNHNIPHVETVCAVILYNMVRKIVSKLILFAAAYGCECTRDPD